MKRTVLHLTWTGPRSGFSLLELLTVIAIVSILTAVTVVSLKNTRIAGTRQGTADVVTQIVELARVTAIEKGVNVYVGFAPMDHPDRQKRLCGYIVFREHTEKEIENNGGQSFPEGSYVALTKWDYLPRGFYWDPNAAASVFQSSESKLLVTDLGRPGTTAILPVIGFDALGQVVKPASGTASIALTEGRYDVEHERWIPDATAAAVASNFSVQVSRLTGRVQFKELTAQVEGTP